MIYKKSFITVVIMLFSSFAQSQEEHINFSILIDGKMEKLSNSKIELRIKNKSETVQVRLIPGELIISKFDYNKIIKLSDKIDSLNLKFEFAKVCKKIKYYQFEIPILSNWLIQPYFLINIYTMDKKANRKLYSPLPNKNYNYQYEYPNSSYRVIQKKLTKEQIRCNKN